MLIESWGATTKCIIAGGSYGKQCSGEPGSKSLAGDKGCRFAFPNNLRRIFSLPSFLLLHSSVFIWGDLERICNSLHLFTLTRVAKPDMPLTYDIILHRNSLETVKNLLWIW